MAAWDAHPDDGRFSFDMGLVGRSILSSLRLLGTIEFVDVSLSRSALAPAGHGNFIPAGSTLPGSDATTSDMVHYWIPLRDALEKAFSNN
jgi:hypothetical protein